MERGWNNRRQCCNERASAFPRPVTDLWDLIQAALSISTGQVETGSDYSCLSQKVLIEKGFKKLQVKKSLTICWFCPDVIVHQTRNSSKEVAYCVDLIAPDSSPPLPYLAGVTGGQTSAGCISLTSKGKSETKGQEEGISHHISLFRSASGSRCLQLWSSCWEETPSPGSSNHLLPRLLG